MLYNNTQREMDLYIYSHTKNIEMCANDHQCASTTCNVHYILLINIQ